MIEKFPIGTSVMLKSGGPLMTVSSYDVNILKFRTF